MCFEYLDSSIRILAMYTRLVGLLDYNSIINYKLKLQKDVKMVILTMLNCLILSISALPQITKLNIFLFPKTTISSAHIHTNINF